ncbi:alpha/beta hydrolase [Dokdonella sp.]|uniref:alpha/beta fold hydrolase n=1 Tax=Dokdonella sp. TaxID=2291710 RepID=UPI002F41D12F
MIRSSRTLWCCCILTMSIARVGAADRPDAALDAYAMPGARVDIGGRALNLRCTGSGPTVLLESGATADSMAWSKVQPEVAKFAHACAYDRAAYGFSDGGPLPRDIDAYAADLHALIHAAHLATPIVLVGHSYGSSIARRYADRYAADVAALVLVDPPPQNVAEFSPAWQESEDEQTAQGLANFRICEQGAARHQLDASPLPPELQRCLRGPDPRYSEALNAAQRAYKARPAFWRTLISMHETSNALYKQPVSPHESHGATPLIVLQPDAPFDDASPDDRKALEAARRKTQAAIAATSTRGEIVAVAHSSHDVHIDRPDAVIEAIRKALRRGVATPAR